MYSLGLVLFTVVNLDRLNRICKMYSLKYFDVSTLNIVDMKIDLFKRTSHSCNKKYPFYAHFKACCSIIPQPEHSFRIVPRKVET